MLAYSVYLYVLSQRLCGANRMQLLFFRRLQVGLIKDTLNFVFSNFTSACTGKVFLYAILVILTQMQFVQTLELFVDSYGQS
jgi:hypothetical protein